MKIIDQSHEIIHLNSDLILSKIEQAGRTCYKSEDKIGCTLEQCIYSFCSTNKDLRCSRYNCEYHSSNKFTKMIKDHRHHAMLEFDDITVRFITNRGATHELVRHRLCSFAQESTRYVRYDGKMEFIRPVWCDARELNNAIFELFEQRNYPDESESEESIFVNTCKIAETYYRMLINKGWRPEQAREVLPNSLKTEIVVKANVREWRHILTLRTSKKAHPQIRALMIPLLLELQDLVPEVFNDINNA